MPRFEIEYSPLEGDEGVVQFFTGHRHLIEGKPGVISAEPRGNRLVVMVDSPPAVDTIVGEIKAMFLPYWVEYKIKRIEE